MNRRENSKSIYLLCMCLFACISTLELSACSSSNENSERGSAGMPAMTAEQCDTNGQIVRASQRDDRYVIQRGDSLSITSYLNSEFNQDVVVRPDGQIAMTLIGNVPAAGLTPQQLADELNKGYSQELRNPDISVLVKNMPSRQVYVEGQVQKPGSFVLDPGMTVLQAVAAAGGLSDQAGKKAVLIRRDACGVPQDFPINLDKAVKDSGQGEDMALLSRDILVVPRSGVANLDLWVNQYIRQMLPINPYVSAEAPMAF
jgi:polysaccharide biosynthesis/export protein